MKTIIHVNRQIIAKNLKEKKTTPPIIVRTYKGSQNCSEVEVNGKLKVVFADGKKVKPLSCGARVWIETNDEVRIVR